MVASVRNALQRLIGFNTGCRCPCLSLGGRALLDKVKGRGWEAALRSYSLSSFSCSPYFLASMQCDLLASHGTTCPAVMDYIPLKL